MGWPRYRGTRGGKKVQEARWRSEGWYQAEDGSWRLWREEEERQPEEYEEHYEEDERFEEISEEPVRSRSPSRQSSNRVNELEAAVEEAQAAAREEAQQKAALAERVRRLEQQLQTLTAPAYTVPREDTPSVPSGDLVEVEVSVDESRHSREGSGQSSGSFHSRWSSDPASEILNLNGLERVEEEVDYSPGEGVFEAPEAAAGEEAPGAAAEEAPEKAAEEEKAPELAAELPARQVTLKGAQALVPKSKARSPQDHSWLIEQVCAEEPTAAKGKSKGKVQARVSAPSSSSAGPDKGKAKGKGKDLKGKDVKGKASKGKGKGASSSSSRALDNEDFRVARGDVFGEYHPREFELERSRRREPSTSSETEQPIASRRRLRLEEAARDHPQPGRWFTGANRWPLQDRVIGFDYHNVLQVKRGRNWIVPLSHLEIIRNLKRLDWSVFLISYVGTDWRVETTRNEIISSGLARELGEENRHWFLVRDKEEKAPLCRRLGIQVFVDDSPQVIASLRAAPYFIYAIPINTPHTPHEDGYHDLAQALAIERILCRASPQDR